MNTSLLNRSIVLKKNSLNPSSIPIEEIKAQLLTYFDSIEPIFNQFPDFAVFILPEQQFSVAFQNGTVAISDDPQTGDGNLPAALKLAAKLNTIFDTKELTAYGVNHTFLAEGVNIEDTLKYINFSGLKESNIVGENATSLSFNISDELTDGKRRNMTFAFAPTEAGLPSENLSCSFNLHIPSNQLLEYAELNQLVSTEETAIREIINKLAS